MWVSGNGRGAVMGMSKGSGRVLRQWQKQGVE